MDETNNDDRQRQQRRHQENLDGQSDLQSENDEVDDDNGGGDDLMSFDGENANATTALAVYEAEQQLAECKKAHTTRAHNMALQMNARRAWPTLPRQRQKTHIPTILLV